MSHTVLLADDDAAIRMVLNQALTRAGYEVRPTGNLSTMWNWVSRGEGDLLITDVAMPDGNAFDIMPKIKKLRPDLPVVVMSAQNTFMTAIRANEVGAYEYLPKPFDITEVLSVVARALAGNLDARQAAARVREARAQELATRRSGGPRVNASAQGGYSRLSENSLPSALANLGYPQAQAVAAVAAAAKAAGDGAGTAQLIKLGLKELAK